MENHIFEPKKIYYRKNEFIAGRQTLVFVHGISGSSSAWLPYENKFQDEFNILTFDLRGHGNSWKPKNLEDYAIKEFSDDLSDLLVHLEIEKFILVSHSFGALIALDFMSEHMSALEKVIFLSPSCAPKRILAAKFLKPFLWLIGILKIFPFKQQGRGQVDYSKFINTGDWNIPRMMADIGKTSWHVYLYGTKQSYEVDYESLLDKIEIPVLLMHGEKDTIFPVDNSLDMYQKLKNSQLIILENANHILVLNNFPEVAKAMEKFIKNI